MGTKSKAMCRTHYFAVYVNVPTAPLPDLANMGRPAPAQAPGGGEEAAHHAPTASPASHNDVNFNANAAAMSARTFQSPAAAGATTLLVSPPLQQSGLPARSRPCSAPQSQRDAGLLGSDSNGGSVASDCASRHAALAQGTATRFVVKSWTSYPSCCISFSVVNVLYQSQYICGRPDQHPCAADRYPLLLGPVGVDCLGCELACRWQPARLYNQPGA